MSDQHFLYNFYSIHADDEIYYDGQKGYSQDNTISFIMPVVNREAVLMEQTVLAYFLKENGFRHLAIPVRNKENEWFTMWQDQSYMVLWTEQLKESDSLSPGEKLAYFHEIGTTYPYEPQKISSYGDWKQLWIYKLTMHEEKSLQDKENIPSSYRDFIIDLFPYLIGISENAIQYVNETNEEHRFHKGDQGTIAFQRYNEQLEEPILWTHELCYDHPARDIAEMLRGMFLQLSEEEEIIHFLKDYEAVRPLSIFSWRLIYARLIYPIHLFDALDRFYEQPQDEHFRTLQRLIENQEDYEYKLRQFFHYSGIDAKNLRIPMLNWL